MLKKCVLLKYLLTILLLLIMLIAVTAAAESVPYKIREVRIDGANGSSILYPQLTGGDPGIAEKVSASIFQLADIEEYQARMDKLTEPSRVLNVTFDYAMDFRWETDPFNPYCSILITALEMENGRVTDQRYIPMTFDLATGGLLPFDRLFTNPGHAKAWIESEIETSVAQEIAPCIRSGSLFPVPYERYYVSGQGDIVLYYEREQLEFVSGYAGAVAFLYDELWDDLDTAPDGAPMALMWPGPLDHAFANRYEPGFDMTESLFETSWNLSLYGMTNDVSLATPLSEALEACHGIIREGDYADGDIWIETEDAQMRGTWLITDQDRQIVTGIYSTRINNAGFVTGKSVRSEWLSAMAYPEVDSWVIDSDTAEKYLTVPGTADVYSLIYDLWILEESTGTEGLGDRVQYIMFADEDGVLRGILFRFQPAGP